MALIKCPECGKEISNQAPACPYCGFPIKAAEPKETQQEAKQASSTQPMRQQSVAHQQRPVNQRPPQKGNASNSNGAGLAGGIVGICAFFFSWIPGFGEILAITGIVLSAVGLQKKYRGKHGMAITGMILSCIAIVIACCVDTSRVVSSTKLVGSTSTTQAVTSDNGDTEETTSNDGKYHVGDIVESSSLRITYISVEDYISDNQFIQPKEGNKFISATFEFENISDTDKYISSHYFDCYADTYAMESTTIRDDNLQATISTGKKTQGTVTFEVPIDATSIDIEYELNAWTSDRAIFVAK